MTHLTEGETTQGRNDRENGKVGETTHYCLELQLIILLVINLNHWAFGCVNYINLCRLCALKACISRQTYADFVH